MLNEMGSGPCVSDGMGCGGAMYVCVSQKENGDINHPSIQYFPSSYTPHPPSLFIPSLTNSTKKTNHVPNPHPLIPPRLLFLLRARG